MTRSARLGAKRNVYSVAMRHAVSAWHLKTQPEPTSTSSTTCHLTIKQQFKTHNSHTELRYSITHIRSIQIRSSSHYKTKPRHLSSEPSLSQHTATLAISTPHGSTRPQHLHKHQHHVHHVRPLYTRLKSRRPHQWQCDQTVRIPNPQPSNHPIPYHQKHPSNNPSLSPTACNPNSWPS